MFLSAQALGISPWERESLEAVMNDLRSGKFCHVTQEEINDGVCVPSTKKAFNMLFGGEADTAPGCGLVGCIGGWMWAKKNTNRQMPRRDKASHMNAYVQSKRDMCSPLEALFYPPDDIRWDEISDRHAAKAIENFLTTGDPQWEQVRGVKFVASAYHL